LTFNWRKKINGHKKTSRKKKGGKKEKKEKRKKKKKKEKEKQQQHKKKASRWALQHLDLGMQILQNPPERTPIQLLELI